MEFMLQLLMYPLPISIRPFGTFAQKLAPINTATEGEVWYVANMTDNKCVECQVRLSDAETEATTWLTAETDGIVIQLERETYGIPSNQQIWFEKKFYIHLHECEAWWQAIGVQVLRRTIKQCVMHFGYPKIYLVSHISESIQQMGSCDNITTNISVWLHISNVNEGYQSTNRVTYIQQMLKHNDWCTGLDYMEETVSYCPARLVWYRLCKWFQPITCCQ